MRIIWKTVSSLSFLGALIIALGTYAAEPKKTDTNDNDGPAASSAEEAKAGESGKGGYTFTCALVGLNNGYGELRANVNFVREQNYYLFYVDTVSYRFIPANGRTKGNINFRIGKEDTNGTNWGSWYKSPDAMIQDGQWHNLVVSKNWPTNRRGLFEVEFIYDRSGDPDAKCKDSRFFQSPG
ncbi:hypothetical protein AB3464_27515 [Pseudomonas asplenii]|uniref:hypothetical protein n=1 Tax=Pseudomonas asplenii TaxID=53407 RepID=UPI0037CBEC86